MRKYQQVSRRIMAVLLSYTDLVEPLSIDEAFLDVGAICRPEKGEGLAHEIKQNIFQREELKASVGVAPNKFLAKIASDLEKPDGLVVVPPGGELAFLDRLPIERLWGVGPKTAERLHREGLHLISDLWGISPERLGLGQHGEHLVQLARGLDDRPVVPSHEPKSIGHETTFSEDTSDPEVVRKTLLKLADAVAVRLRKHGVRGKTVTLKFRDQDFVTETRAHTLREETDEAATLYAVALAQLDRVKVAGRKIRLLGISVSKLSRENDPRQLSLFREATRDERLSRARDALEARFGKGSVERASLLASKDLHPLAPPGVDDDPD